MPKDGDFLQQFHHLASVVSSASFHWALRLFGGRSSSAEADDELRCRAALLGEATGPRRDRDGAEGDAVGWRGGGRQITITLQSGKLEAQELPYSVTRLVRGVQSSREFCRPGFSLAIAELLHAMPSQALTVLKEIDKATELQSGLRANEAKDRLLGRCFVYGAILQAGCLRVEEKAVADIIARLSRGLWQIYSARSYLNACSMCLLKDACEELCQANRHERVAEIISQWKLDDKVDDSGKGLNLLDPHALGLILKLRVCYEEAEKKPSSWPSCVRKDVFRNHAPAVARKVGQTLASCPVTDVVPTVLEDFCRWWARRHQGRDAKSLEEIWPAFEEALVTMRNTVRCSGMIQMENRDQAMLGRSGRRSLPVLKGRGIEAAPEPSRDALPQGWIRVESRSKPGTFYYAHPATKRTQMERPVDPHRARSTGASGAAPVEKPKAEPVEEVEDVETAEEKRKREEARKAEEKAREEEEERERQEVLMRARQRRAQERLEEEKRRKEEEEQEEEERQKLAERRREKKQKQEEEKRESERLQKEAEEKRHKEMEELNKALDQATPTIPVSVGRRSDGTRHSGAKWKKEASDEEEEVTQEDLEKWKEDEERREREEVEAKRRKIEEEERRKREAELAEQRKKAEFAAAVERARQMKIESDRQKQEELRKETKEARKSSSSSPSPPRVRDPQQPAQPGQPAGQPAGQPGQPGQPAGQPGQPAPMAPVVFAPPAAPVEAPSLQQAFLMPPKVVPPPPPPKPAPTPPTLANLLSGAVAKPDFGSLLKNPKPPEAAANAPSNGQDTGPQTGTILWYNGRRKCGLLLADRDQRQLSISGLAVNTGHLAPPVPAGLMHGTRVSYLLDLARPGSAGSPANVRPLPHQSGLSCGGDSQMGPRLANEDRTIATDLQDSLGHMVGIFDGHRGTFCADYLSQEVPKMIVQGVREAFSQRLKGASLDMLSAAEEAEVIKLGIIRGLEMTDQNFLNLAQQYGFKDGASALIAVVMHGFQEPHGRTVPTAPGGQAKLFAAWSGTGHMLLLRGRQVLRCTEDHVCDRAEERHRLSTAGGQLVQDLRGVWWLGRPGNPELTWARQQCYEDVAGPKNFLAASRGFGDLLLKGPPYPVFSASPEVQVIDLLPEDWAVVVATRGVFAVLSDQDVANACWDVMAQQGAGPQEAAQTVTQRALQMLSLKGR
ncbi:unnamed protein product [Durusdinium trenchii]|uniref:Uncharacterized protein n=1 Tax=Durusdinium trenchii TaxID=1381693 RepID=A0ABP0QRQ3_9DINO